MAFEFYNMLPGDALVSEIRRTCTGSQLEKNLEIARQLAFYDSMYNESLTFGEFVEAYHPRDDSEAEEDPE